VNSIQQKQQLNSGSPDPRAQFLHQVG